MDTTPQLQDALLDLFRSLTPEQLSFLTQQSASSSPASSAASPRSFNSIDMSSAEQSPTPMAQTTVSRAPRTSRGKARKVKAAGYPKKALNAFITYRTYYSPQFAGLTQKVKSGLMRSMWSDDGRKHIWTLIGSAFTDIRDNHTDSLRLDKFLAIIISAVPIIPASSYLHKMGWDLTTDAAGEAQLTRSHTFDRAALLAEYPEQTNKSVEELVNHCYASGLVRPGSRIRQPNAQGNMVTLPFAAAPRVGGPVQTPAATITDDRVFDIEQDLNKLTDPATMSTLEFNFNDFRPDYHPSINAVTADQQQAYERTPFALHFHPDIQPPVLGFDPNIIQDDFDPFSLYVDAGEYLDFAD